MVAVRRWLGGAAALAIGLGLLVPAEAAHASVGGAVVAASDTAQVTGDPGCAHSLTGPRPGFVAVAADGAWHGVELDRSGALGPSALRATGVAKGRVSGDAWGTTRVDLTIAAAASLRPSGRSVCAARYELHTSVGGVDVSAARPSWLVVRSTGTLRGPVTGELGAYVDGVPAALTAPGRSLTRLVRAGRYEIGGLTRATLQVPASSTTAQSASAQLTATLSLHPVGTLRRQRGTARAFLTAGHRDCSSRSVTMTLTARAHRSARRITLTVGGKRAKVLTGAALGRATVRLKRIPARSDGVVRASVLLRSGAVRTLRATSWPCA